uniref:Uncharacterized protein n=1 Tax=viral metagenome TaxID=1070528 RepID=A0A6C0EPN3_9ZZZZ
MTQPQEFLKDFESSLDKLNQLNDLIKKNAEQKQEFTNFISKRLSEINEKVKTLSSGIQELKNKLQSLQQEIDANKAGISNNAKQVDDLQKQVDDLNLEKQKLMEQLKTSTESSNQKIQEIQDKINADEAKIRDLTTQNETLNTQLKKQDENNNTIKQLQQKIEDQDQQIQKLQGDHASSVNQTNDQIKALTQSEAELKQKIEQLNQQIEQLQNENKDLQQRIIAATQAINVAVGNLQNISDDAKNNENTENVSKLFAQVEASIEDISRSIQGQPLQQQPSSVSATQLSIPNNEPVVGVNGAPQGLTYESLLNQLKTKSNQISPGRANKYSDALIKLRSINSINEIPQILDSNGIIFKNNIIFGGKKYNTKKNKKQKGGFTYKVNSKRKSISTNSLTFNAKDKGKGKSKRTTIKRSF